jgi:hypothetical protein
MPKSKTLRCARCRQRPAVTSFVVAGACACWPVCSGCASVLFAEADTETQRINRVLAPKTSDS